MSTKHPTDNGVPVVEAARRLGKHPATVRRMIARGAPCIRPGEVGRGKGALLNLEDLQRWRAGDYTKRDDMELLERIAIALGDALRRDEVHIRIGVTERQAAGVLALAYQRIWQNITRKPLDELSDLPPGIKQLCAIFVE